MEDGALNSQGLQLALETTHSQDCEANFQFRAAAINRP